MFRTVCRFSCQVLELDSAFIYLISKQKRKELEVPDILIVSVIMTLIPFSTVKVQLIEQVHREMRQGRENYGTGEGTGSPTYLP